jgi:RNA polymerase sigma-70 factor (ECF subfamily)
LKVINIYQTEEELIRQAVDNNRQAQHKIYVRFSPKMLAICRRYCKDIQEAEDVLVIAFTKVFANLKHFKNEGNLEGWIRRIIINECISFLRIRKKVVFIEEESFLDDGFNSIEIQFSVEQILYLIDRLPEGYKMIFNLYAIEGFKHQEIASMLGISEGTSKSQLSHARKILKEQISKLNKENGTK